MILIFFYCQKRSFNLFLINDLIQFHLYLIFKKIYFHLLYQNNLLQNFNLATKMIFTCFYKKKLQFYLQKYFNLFSFNIYIYIYISLQEN